MNCPMGSQLSPPLAWATVDRNMGKDRQGCHGGCDVFVVGPSNCHLGSPYSVRSTS